MLRSSRPVFFGLALAVATPGLSSAEKLPVFKLAESHADPEQARALLSRMHSGKLPAEAKSVERSGAVGYRAGNTMVEIETASGGIFAANLDQLWNPRLSPRLLDRAAARQQADAFLAENGLLPKEEGYVRISEPLYSESGVAPDAPGGKKTVLDVQVNYQVSIALDAQRRVPVVGGGGEFKVALGDGGALIGYAGTWRPILGVASEVEVMSQAAAEAQYRASVRDIKIVNLQSYLAYYSAPSFEAQAYLAPVWVMRGEGELQGRRLPLREATLAATKFGPSYRAIALQPRTERAPRVFDDYVYEGGTSWIGPSQGLGGSPANAQGFVNGLAAAGWAINFNWGEGNAWESDWNANDDYYVDAVDFAFYTGHANSDGWVLNPPADTFLHFSEVGAWPGSPDDHYGSTDLEWMTIAACGPHQSNHFVGGIGSAFDRWRGIFDGLHIQMGYGAVTFDNTTEGSRLTELSRAGWTLVDAWFRTAWEIQPATNGWAAPNGDIIFVTAMYAHLGDHAVRYDRMWGAGFVAADPVGPYQQRHLLWSGT